MLEGGRKKLLFLFASVIILLLPVFVLAQNVGLNYAENFGLQGAAESDLRDMIVSIVRYFLTFVGIVAVAIIIYGGFLWMTSNGQPERIAKAKRALVSALIGLAIVMSAFFIVEFVINVTTDTISGGRCSAGDPPRSCGCQNMGIQTCQPDGTWGACSADCDYAGGESCCSFGCAADCSIPPEFYINSYIPEDGAEDVARNVRIRFSFNRRLVPATVNGSTFEVSGSMGTNGTISVRGNNAYFRPNGPCGANDCGLADSCFAEGEVVTVTAINGAAGILSVGGIVLDCPGGGLDCAMSFTVGSAVDCRDPEVNLDITQVCAIANNEFHASASDDNGISQIEFFAEGSSVPDSDNPLLFPGITPADTRSLPDSVTFDATALAGANIEVRATADDIASRQNSASRSFRVNPGHCCNGILDAAEGEEGVDCGGPCAACAGAACGASMNDDCADAGVDCSANNSLCASGLCSCIDPAASGLGFNCGDRGYNYINGQCCLCQDAPIIDWVSPEGGFCRDDLGNPTDSACWSDEDCLFMPGSCDLSTANISSGGLVAIGGRYFGAYGPGSRVEFESSGAWIEARLAEEVNGNCADSWTAGQIVVEAPSGLAGAFSETMVRVTSDAGFSDTSGADGRGRIIEIIENNIIRPGLCSVSPDSGRMNQLLNYEGINLAGVNAYFGNTANNYRALSSDFTPETSGTARVPNIIIGRTSTFVAHPASGAPSNYLSFVKLPEAEAGPYITSFEPLAGAPGQYVTIYGGGFGRRQADSRVFFGDIAGVEADYDFPAQCADSVWSDNQIVVKVPAAANGDFIITIDLNSGEAASTSMLTPSRFNIDSSLDLTPSLCRISPIMGPNLSEISLWGEYFGIDNPGSVRFHLNREQTGGIWSLDGQADRIDTVIHAQAASGPVRVFQSGRESNGLNLSVGSCLEADDPDAACGAQICCGPGTYNQGRCADSQNDCYQDIAASVLEWDFTTDYVEYSSPGDPCSTPDPLTCNDGYPACNPADGTVCQENASGPCTCQYPNSDSCQGVSLNTGRCDPIACPNSPGECSPYPGGAPVSAGSECSDSFCNSQFSLDCGGSCGYSGALNRCIDLNQAGNPDCSLASTDFQDVLGNTVNAVCRLFQGTGRWHIRTNLSCPSTDWQMLLGECVNTAIECDACNDNFVCRDDGDNDGSGLCSIGGQICAGGSSCEAGECIRYDNASCECCCDINQNSPAGGINPACCAPLTCGVDCGSGGIDLTGDGDYDDPGEADFGACMGCTVMVGGVPDQAASDAACNCSGTAGKACDMGAAGGIGVCRDCAQFTDPSVCSDHNTVCCVDAESGNRCRGGEGVQPGGYLSVENGGYGPMETDNGDPGLGYCAYFDCEADNTCNNENNIIASSSDRVFRSVANCESVCSSLSGASLGLSCYGTSPGYMTNNCDPSVCPAPFQCLQPNGTPGIFSSQADTCGICCCSDDQQCANVNAGLTCHFDSAPCDGPGRGLCCGCEADSDCAAGSPEASGCGTDTCCHARPGVSTIFPEDDAVNICRNTGITVEFDQIMDISSFSGNVILAADYASQPCPAGLEYLTFGERSYSGGMLARLWQGILFWFEKHLPVRLVKAYTDPNSGYTHNYCAVPISVNGHNDSLNDSGTLEIMPRQLLDPGRLYYVIVKGDRNLDSAQGIRNIWGVGMNGTILPSPSGGNNTFNGVDYSRALVWSFTTLPEQSRNNGVCEIDRVIIEPASYLFQNVSPDPAENDLSPAADSFDTINDNDKVFRAYALGRDGSILSPTPGYSWDWVWGINNPAVALINSPAGLESDRSLIQSADGITDASTYATAEAQFTDVPPGMGDLPVSGRADIFVFFCANPWPPVINGSWSPWRDNSVNCLAGTGNCPNMNYEIYYCRDEGNFGTFDDLPAIVSTSTIIRGTSLKCDDGNGNCEGLGINQPCSDGTGRCIYDIFKETFFFRESSPTSTTILEIGNGLVGQTATASWDNVAQIDGNIDGYRLYWGESSGEYEDYAQISNSGNSDNPAVSCIAAGRFDCSISGLTNSLIYYFNLTAFYDNGSESVPMGEQSVYVEDVAPPAAPGAPVAAPQAGAVELSWTGTQDAFAYRVYYGVSPGIYGASSDVGSETNVVITGLNAGTEYFFAISALDEYNNESPVSPPTGSIPE